MKRGIAVLEGGHRIIVVLVLTLALSSAVFIVVLNNRGGSGPAHFGARATHFAWLFGHTYVTYDIHVTNVGARGSNFQCGSDVFGVDGVTMTFDPNPLSPGSTRVVIGASSLVPPAYRHDALLGVASHTMPICTPIPPIRHIYVH